MRSQLDLERLRSEIREMTRAHALYKVLRDELTIKGYWKRLPRGEYQKESLQKRENESI